MIIFPIKKSLMGEVILSGFKIIVGLIFILFQCYEKLFLNNLQKSFKPIFFLLTENTLHYQMQK